MRAPTPSDAGGRPATDGLQPRRAKTTGRRADQGFPTASRWQINDLYGHPKGDEVLAAVGAALPGAVRESDLVGRHGGEEFIVLLPDTSREGPTLVAEKLRETLATLTVIGVERSITASFGVAVLPDDAGDATQLVRNADRALYRAKTAGRDRIELVTSDVA